MQKFENVTVIKKANIYYNGKVTSRTIEFADGSIKTLGIMLPGEYTFSTEAAEIMEILAGEVEVLLPDETKWQTKLAKSSFKVPANAKFVIKIQVATDYCCSYL